MVQVPEFHRQARFGARRIIATTNDIKFGLLAVRLYPYETKFVFQAKPHELVGYARPDRMQLAMPALGQTRQNSH